MYITNIITISVYFLVYVQLSHKKKCNSDVVVLKNAGVGVKITKH